ncbi:MAG: hypothetical protein IPN71_09680 [Fibrobacteres bacterium]|nr:hypothetical protein [Fibrobacterota bacterium]
MSTFWIMLTPALLLQSVLLSLSQMTGLVRSPLDSLPTNAYSWASYPVGTQIVWKSQGFDSVGVQTDSMRWDIQISTDRRMNWDLTRSTVGSEDQPQRLREIYWGISQGNHADSMKQFLWTDSTGWVEAFSYREKVAGAVKRWIVMPGPAWASSAPFDTLEQSESVPLGLKVRREVDFNGLVHVDSVWKSADGTPLRASEALTTPPQLSWYFALVGQTHSYVFRDGHMVFDTIRSHGYENGNTDTSWTDTLRYQWENGRLIRYTSAIDTVWMEWSATGLPIRHLHHTWSPRFPNEFPRNLSIRETRFDDQGREISYLETSSHSDYFSLDTNDFQGSLPLPSKSVALSCRKSSKVSMDFSRENCRIQDVDVFQWEISGVPVRSPAKGVRQATVRMDGKKAIFQNLSIAVGVLEMVSLDGKNLGQTPVTDGQATLAHPPRGVSLWRVRSPAGAASEASRLILP